MELRTAGREEVVKYGGEVIKDRARGHRARRRAGDGQLHSVELADGQAVSRAAVFIGPRFVPHDELLTSLGCQVDDNGWVATDATGRSSAGGMGGRQRRGRTAGHRTGRRASESARHLVAGRVQLSDELRTVSRPPGLQAQRYHHIAHPQAAGDPGMRHVHHIGA